MVATMSVGNLQDVVEDLKSSIEMLTSAIEKNVPPSPSSEETPPLSSHSTAVTVTLHGVASGSSVHKRRKVQEVDGTDSEEDVPVNIGGPLRTVPPPPNTIPPVVNGRISVYFTVERQWYDGTILKLRSIVKTDRVNETVAKIRFDDSDEFEVNLGQSYIVLF